MSHAVPLGPGREFDVVRAMLARWGELARGVGDDAAIIEVPAGELLVASTDSSVEDVHFRRDWLTPREIGFRATMAALSDLAAMGAAPLGVLVALSLSPAWLAHVEALADGVGEAVREAATVVRGGDLSRASALTLGLTVLGSTPTPLRRDAVRAGEQLYLTGRLGGVQLALRSFLAGRAPPGEARERFARPVARLREARWLARAGARAAIDISDGLLGDLAHLAAASAVRLVVELDRVPTMAGVSPEDAARSGEEYELVVSAPAALETAAFVREFHLPLTVIGRAEHGPPEVRATLDGERVASTAGFDHFS